MAWSLLLAASTVHAAPVRTRGVPAQAIVADAQATAICPDRVAGELLYAVALEEGTPAEQRAVRQRYDREVARWAVCARTLQLATFGIPAVEDTVANALLAASLTEPGRRARVEAIQAAAGEMPFPSAVLALEELATLEVISRAEPQRRVELAAAAFGAWGCPESAAWESPEEGLEYAWCPDRRSLDTLATAGLQALVTLAQPTVDPGDGWLAAATQSQTQAWWETVESVWFPLREPPPLRVPEGGRGVPLEPNLGWSGRVTPDLVVWQERPAFRVTPAGIVVNPPTLRSRAPTDWDGAPVLYIDGNVRLARVAEVLAQADVALPRFVALRQDATTDGDLVELRLFFQPLAEPPPGAAVVDLRPIGGSLTAMRRAVEEADGEGPAWLRADPAVRYADLVAATSAVSGIRKGPVVVSLAIPPSLRTAPEPTSP